MSTNFNATIDNFEGVIESNEDVELVADGNGGFRLTANGHNLSLLNVSRLVLRRAGVSSGAVNTTLPSGESRFVSSERSAGAEDRAPEGSTFTPVYQGKAAQDEETPVEVISFPHEGASSEETEVGPVDTPAETEDQAEEA